MSHRVRGLSKHVCRESENVSCSVVSLCDLMDCSPPGSYVLGILQARTLEWVAMPSSREIFLTQGSNLSLLHCGKILYHLNHKRSPSICVESIYKGQIV